MSKEMDILEHSALNGFNVLLIGKHGVGKTAMVKEVFEKIGWTWKYFSASTIDPWVDLVGVPKEVNGVLELIRPADLAFDQVEAFFFDEYNRAPKKVRNAVMEVIQFGSINGKKFPNLKVVFAAINPDDDEELNYDVERLDPAQVDRFHIHLPVESEPCPYYFKRTHGNTGTLAVKWWQEQTKEVKDLISPRRLEAGVRVFMSDGGDPQFVFDPVKVNVGEFCEYLDKEDPVELLERMKDLTDAEKKKFLGDNNNYKHVKKDLLGKTRYLNAFGHCIPEMHIMPELRTRGNKITTHVVANVKQFEHLIPNVLANRTPYAGSVVDAFDAYRKSNGMTSSPASLNRKVTIKGKKVAVSDIVMCFTGKLSGYTRAQAQETIENYGAKAVDTPNFQTTHVVAGDKPGDKMERAKKQGIEIITEQEFYKIVQELDTPAALTKK